MRNNALDEFGALVENACYNVSDWLYDLAFKFADWWSPRISPWPSIQTNPGFYSSMSLCRLAWGKRTSNHVLISGMMAQAEAESAFNLRAVGDLDKAFGLHQWRQPRCDAIKMAIGIDVRTATMDESVEAAWWELNNTAHLALIMVGSATKPYEAGYYAAKYFEMPSSHAQYDKRGLMAERLHKYNYGTRVT